MISNAIYRACKVIFKKMDVNILYCPINDQFDPYYYFTCRFTKQRILNKSIIVIKSVYLILHYLQNAYSIWVSAYYHNMLDIK